LLLRCGDVEVVSLQKWNPVRAAMLGAVAGLILGVPQYYPRIVAGGPEATAALAQLAGMAIGLGVLAAVVCVIRNALIKD